MDKRTCAHIDGCGEPAIARDLCKNHYNSAYRSGTLPPRKIPQPDTHSLSSIRLGDRLADCAVCGPSVPISVRERSPSQHGLHPHGRYRIQCATRRRWQAKYKMTTEEYGRLQTEQAGHCAICGAVPDKLHIDHDHITEEVRGLLCHPCNIALGWLRDSPEIAARAARYLSAT